MRTLVYLFLLIFTLLPTAHMSAGHTTSEVIAAATPYCNPIDYELHDACRTGDFDRIKKILSQDKTKINTRAYLFGYTPLELACMNTSHDKPNIIEYLVAQGAEVNFYTNPLLKTIRENQRVVDLLQYKEAQRIEKLSEKIISAWQHNKFDTVQNLLKQVVNLNQNFGEYERTILHQAVICSDVDLVSFLLEQGANPNVQDTDERTPLHHSIEDSKFAVFNVLLKYGADYRIVDKASIKPLDLTISCGNWSMAEKLLNIGADSTNQEALHFAVLSYAANILNKLLLREYNPNIQNKDGNTPIHLVVMRQWSLATDRREIRKLISYGASLTLTNSDGLTPLQQAQKNPRCAEEVMTYLDQLQNTFDETIKNPVDADELMLGYTIHQLYLGLNGWDNSDCINKLIALAKKIGLEKLEMTLREYKNEDNYLSEKKIKGVTEVHQKFTLESMQKSKFLDFKFNFE